MPGAYTMERAQDFIWRNARLLDRQRFRFLFAGGLGEAVLTALSAYQNADGGFGNALEPDMRSPDSQPVACEVALQVLDEAGIDGDLVQDLCDFLDTITTEEGGVPFVLPSVRAYPHAPWWETDDHPPASINPTAGIAGLLHKHGVRHRWLERATEYCWSAIAASPSEEVHELAATIAFLQHAPDRARAERAFAPIGERILAKGLVALDPSDTGYVKKPLDWAPSPDGLCRRLFSDTVIAAHLDGLAATQAEDGGWPIAWPAVGPGGEMEWRGSVTVAALKTLQAYGRLR